MDWTCVCTGDLPNDSGVEAIIGKRFDDNNKVEWLVKWMACGLREAMWVPLNNSLYPNEVCEGSTMVW